MPDSVRHFSWQPLIVAPRGGGASYTGGYVTADPARTITLDLRGLDQILEVNSVDMYAVVEAGVTWEGLHRRLATDGLRSRVWGTIPGLHATVGGSVSQNAVFWGSGGAGTLADAVLGLEVIVGSGAIMRTGSMGVTGSNPFFRHFGPDLTGLFTGDSGGLGIKTKVVLSLEHVPHSVGHLSFNLGDGDAACALLSNVARRGLCAQQMALDGKLQSARLQSEGLMSDLHHAWSLFTNSRSSLEGAKRVFSVARAGRDFSGSAAFGSHHWMEGSSDAEVRAKEDAVRRIAREIGAVEVESSVPKVMTATPFGPLNGITGPKGERWVPVHGIFPHSQASAALRAVASLFQARARDIESHSVRTGYLLSTMGKNGVLIEPMFMWPDRLTPLHDRFLGDKRKAKLPAYPEAQATRSLVRELRSEVIARFDELGAVHLQIGRTYPFTDRLCGTSADVISAVVKALDPERVINPGVLP